MSNKLIVNFPNTVGMVRETNPLTGAEYIYFFTPNEGSIDKSNAGVGYIYLEDVTTFTWEPEPAPTPTPTPEPTPTFPYAYETIVSGLRLREKPTTSATVIKSLPLGTIAEANSENIVQSIGFEWLLVTVKDVEHNTSISGYLAIKQLSTGKMYVKKIRG